MHTLHDITNIHTLHTCSLPPYNNLILRNYDWLRHHDRLSTTAEHTTTTATSTATNAATKSAAPAHRHHLNASRLVVPIMLWKLWNIPVLWSRQNILWNRVVAGRRRRLILHSHHNTWSCTIWNRHLQRLSRR